MTTEDARDRATQVSSMAPCVLLQGASIIDVGGQSTRPGAAALSAEEEEARVVPVVRAMRQCRELDQTPISVDTFHAKVRLPHLSTRSRYLSRYAAVDCQTGGTRPWVTLARGGSPNLLLVHLIVVCG